MGVLFEAWKLDYLVGALVAHGPLVTAQEQALETLVGPQVIGMYVGNPTVAVCVAVV